MSGPLPVSVNLCVSGLVVRCVACVGGRGLSNMKNSEARALITEAQVLAAGMLRGVGLETVGPDTVLVCRIVLKVFLKCTFWPRRLQPCQLV